MADAAAAPSASSRPPPLAAPAPAPAGAATAGAGAVGVVGNMHRSSSHSLLPPVAQAGSVRGGLNSSQRLFVPPGLNSTCALSPLPCFLCIHIRIYTYIYIHTYIHLYIYACMILCICDGLDVMHRYSTTTSASGASPRTVRLIVHPRPPRPWLLHIHDPNNTVFRFHIRTVRGEREALQPSSSSFTKTAG
jgi:hypothetical protein